MRDVPTVWFEYYGKLVKTNLILIRLVMISGKQILFKHDKGIERYPCDEMPNYNNRSLGIAKLGKNIKKRCCQKLELRVTERYSILSL